MSTPTAYGRRPILARIKWFLVNLLCLFVPSKKYRELIRYYSLRYRVRLGHPPLPVKKRPRPINVAFGFDGRIARPAGVTLASLLINSKNRADYNLHCVVDDSVTPEMRDALTDLVRGMAPGSSIRFLDANHDFDRGLPDNLPVAVCFRLMLPALLPELDEIIYADTDVIFLRDLIELADVDLGDHLLAAVRENTDGYINSGLMVMNLARLRREKISETWPEKVRLGKGGPYVFPEQDLLNITCRGRILHLPVKFNFFHHMYHNIYRRGGITPKDHHELKYGAVMLHYACCVPKPWLGKRFYMSRLWWEYARLTPFYEELRAELN